MNNWREFHLLWRKKKMREDRGREEERKSGRGFWCWWMNTEMYNILWQWGMFHLVWDGMWDIFFPLSLSLSCSHILFLSFFFFHSFPLFLSLPPSSLFFPFLTLPLFLSLFIMNKFVYSIPFSHSFFLFFCLSVHC